MAPHTPPPQDRSPAVVRLPGNLPTAASVLIRHAQRGRADFQLKLDDSGRYEYFCRIHDGPGMTGVIDVQ